MSYTQPIFHLHKKNKAIGYIVAIGLTTLFAIGYGPCESVYAETITARQATATLIEQQEAVVTVSLTGALKELWKDVTFTNPITDAMNKEEDQRLLRARILAENKRLDEEQEKREKAEELKKEKALEKARQEAIAEQKKKKALEMEKRKIHLNNDQRIILERIVQAEAGNQSMKGKMLVANVVMNRVKSKKFPNTVKGVVYQHKGGVYQFSPVQNGSINRVKVSSNTKKAVTRVLNGEDYSKGALYFVAKSSANKRSVSWFDRNLTRLFQCGAHTFYR